MSEAPPQSEIPQRPVQWTDRSITVLHVDDDSSVVDLAAEFLERTNERLVVHTETDPRDVLDIIDTTDVDCIVSDYEMPKMDGLELLEEVREMYPNLPYILFTGKGNEEIASEAITAGVTDYLQKSTGTEQYRVLSNRIVNSVERYRAERTQEVFQAAVEYAGHSIYITDNNGVIEYVNPTFEDITGYPVDEALGKTPRLFKSGYHDKEFYSELWETILSGEVWQSEIVNERKGGDQYVVSQTIAPILDDTGNPWKFIAINYEITDRKKRETRLQSFKEAIDHSGHAVFITNCDGTITYVNSAFEEITGYSEDEVLGHTPRILRSGVQDDEYYSELWERILSGEVWEEQIVNERKDGERYHADQTIAPLVDGGGEVMGFVAIQRDITELKEYEQTLEQQRNNLTILNQMISHDIRNDLQMIRGHAELLEEHIDEEGSEYLEGIIDGSRNAIELTDTAQNLADVLLRTDIDHVPVPLAEPLEKVLKEVQSTYRDAGITTKDDLPEVTVSADELLESVFRNLLKNAVQHNDKETPKIIVSTEVTDEHVEIEIADNGPGIPDDRKEAIFQKGESRLDEDDQRGLGLYLVQMLIEQYDGSIWVEDNTPEGTVFTVRIPRSQPQ